MKQAIMNVAFIPRKEHFVTDIIDAVKMLENNMAAKYERSAWYLKAGARDGEVHKVEAFLHDG
jgi:hypothetical protein